MKKKVLKLFPALVLSYGGVCSFPWMLGREGSRLWYTNSIWAVFLFCFLLWLTGRALPALSSGKSRRWFLPGVCGTLFAVCMVFGAQLDAEGSVPFQRGSMWAAILISAVLFTLLVRYGWEILAVRLQKRWEQGPEPKEIGEEEKRSWNEPKKKWDCYRFLRTAAVIFVCYLPVFLAVYPGFFVYDAQEEYLQVVTRNFSTHHPLMHVLLLGGIIQLFFKLTGSVNAGIACYTVFQMTVMSFIFAWCVERMRKRGMKRRGGILLTLYFGLCPVLVMFSLCSAKDGLFTGALLITLLLLQDLYGLPACFFQKKRKVLFLAVSSTLMMLLRHNGFYAFLVFAAISLLFLKKYRKRVLLCFSGILLGYLAVSFALTGIFHADAGEHQEILTVPISQVARVYVNEKESLPPDERELLCRYLPEEALLRYTPKVTDGVKIGFNNAAYEADKSGFLKLWLKWGREHPFIYLNAWFMTSYGFWYPDTVIDVYRGNTVFTYTYGDSSYFGYEVEEPGIRESRIPWLNELYRRMSLEISQQKLPVISMFFSPGFLFWVFLFLLGFLCDQGYWTKALPYVLPLLVWCTVILGPTYLVRYVVFLWVAVPLLVWECFFAQTAGQW